MATQWIVGSGRGRMRAWGLNVNIKSWNDFHIEGLQRGAKGADASRHWA